MKTKVKVDRQKLIEAIEARKAEAKAEHEKVIAKHDPEEAYQAAIDKLETALEKLRNGQWPKVDWSGDIRIGVKPQAPKKKFDSRQYDRDIKLLSMSSESTISLNTDDFARYVR